MYMYNVKYLAEIVICFNQAGTGNGGGTACFIETAGRRGGPQEDVRTSNFSFCAWSDVSMELQCTCCVCLCVTCSSVEEEHVQALQQQMAEIKLREEEVRGGGGRWVGG